MAPCTALISEELTLVCGKIKEVARCQNVDSAGNKSICNLKNQIIVMLANLFNIYH